MLEISPECEPSDDARMEATTLPSVGSASGLSFLATFWSLHVVSCYDEFRTKRPLVHRNNALCNSRRRNHEVWSHREEGPGHCSISKKLLSVQISTFYI